MQQLQKALATARQELEALRQQRDQQAELLNTMQERSVQQKLQGQLQCKAAALAASEKKLRQSQAILQRLAAKAGGGSGP